MEITQRSPNTFKVLVVDDAAPTVEIVEAFLNMEGYQTITALDGQTALGLVESESPDLLLLDINMPGMNGYEVCNRIKSNPDTHFMPIIMLTALHAIADKVRSAEVGADDFIAKPFNHLELVTRVRSLLRIKQLYDTLADYNRKLEEIVARRTAALRRAVAELQKMDQIKTNFIANVSHELRTPLSYVTGYLTLLEEDTFGPLTNQQADALTIAIEGAHRLEHLVNDLLSFDELIHEPFELEPVDIGRLITQVVHDFRIPEQRNEIKINLQLPATLPKVLGDSKALCRALYHLLDNAVKFSPGLNDVIISAYPISGQDKIAINVVDHGIGIPADKLHQVFASFFQVDDTTTRSFGGIGLGLTVVKLIVERHKSQLHVKSVEGQGSRFSFELAVA